MSELVPASDVSAARARRYALRGRWLGRIVLLAIGLIACGGKPAPVGASGATPAGFYFDSTSSGRTIAINGPVRCTGAAHALYVSAPDPIPTSPPTWVLSLIVGSYGGSGTYRNLTDNGEDPSAVLLELLDYTRPTDQRILAVGVSGHVDIQASQSQVSGHLDAALRGATANHVTGNWDCQMSEPSSTPSITPAPAPSSSP